MKVAVKNSKKGEVPHLTQDTFVSPIGLLTLLASERGIAALLWENEPPHRVKLAKAPKNIGVSKILDRTKKQLAEYFEGKRVDFSIPLDLTGTPFQLAAWKALTEIPFAETISYQEQAVKLGNPKLTRAVGAANGKNPVSILVPCHRVIGKNGELTGFAAGLPTKQFLLDHEVTVLMLKQKRRSTLLKRNHVSSLKK